jgi:hypothetical protein
VVSGFPDRAAFFFADEDEPLETATGIKTGMTRWSISIPGKASAIILVPEDIAEADWGLINTIVLAYIAHAAKAAKSLRERGRGAAASR